MKISTTKTRTPKIIIIASIFLVTATFAYGLFSYNTGNWPFSTQQATTQDGNKQPSTEPSSALSSSSKPEEYVPTEKLPTQYEKVDDNHNPPSGELSARITALSQTADIVLIRTLINAVIANGQCSLSLKKDGEEYTATSDIQALAQNSSCKGFDVPKNELSKGTWIITIRINSNGKSTLLSEKLDVL